MPTQPHEVQNTTVLASLTSPLCGQTHNRNITQSGLETDHLDGCTAAQNADAAVVG